MLVARGRAETSEQRGPEGRLGGPSSCVGLSRELCLSRNRGPLCCTGPTKSNIYMSFPKYCKKQLHGADRGGRSAAAGLRGAISRSFLPVTKSAVVHCCLLRRMHPKRLPSFQRPRRVLRMRSSSPCLQPRSAQGVQYSQRLLRDDASFDCHLLRSKLVDTRNTLD